MSAMRKRERDAKVLTLVALGLNRIGRVAQEQRLMAPSFRNTRLRGWMGIQDEGDPGGGHRWVPVAAWWHERGKSVRIVPGLKRLARSFVPEVFPYFPHDVDWNNRGFRRGGRCPQCPPNTRVWNGRTRA
jgi:hypothetical protein